MIRYWSLGSNIENLVPAFVTASEMNPTVRIMNGIEESGLRSFDFISLPWGREISLKMTWKNRTNQKIFSTMRHLASAVVS